MKASQGIRATVCQMGYPETFFEILNYIDMRIKTVFPVKGMSGKADKDDELVFSTRYGGIYAWEMKVNKQQFSEAQIAIHERFKSVTALVMADMADPEKKKEWEEKARQSDGKYKTARGCAFAHYWAAEEA